MLIFGASSIMPLCDSKCFWHNSSLFLVSHSLLCRVVQEWAEEFVARNCSHLSSAKGRIADVEVTLHAPCRVIPSWLREMHTILSLTEKLQNA